MKSNRKARAGAAKVTKFFREKGFYVVLVVCVVATGIASYLGVQNAREQRTQENASLIAQKKTENSGAEVKKEVSNLPVSPEQSSSSVDASSSLEESSKDSGNNENSENTANSEKQLYILPAAGKTDHVFSGDDLVFYPTLKSWKTHNGIDISCPSGTPVKATNDGTITKICEDPLWGVVIEISHADGKISRVCGLSPTVKVHEKDTVQIGTVLGEVGTVPSESNFSHLHFEILDHGKAIDPLLIITSGT